jgi:hypothetical protein
MTNEFNIEEVTTRLSLMQEILGLERVGDITMTQELSE